MPSSYSKEPGGRGVTGEMSCIDSGEEAVDFSEKVVPKKDGGEGFHLLICVLKSRRPSSCNALATEYGKEEPEITCDQSSQDRKLMNFGFDLRCRARGDRSSGRSDTRTGHPTQVTNSPTSIPQVMHDSVITGINIYLECSGSFLAIPKRLQFLFRA